MCQISCACGCLSACLWQAGALLVTFFSFSNPPEQKIHKLYPKSSPMIEEAPKWRSEEHRQMKWSVERSDYFCFTEVLFFKVPLKAWETCVTLHWEDGGAEGWFDKRWKKGSDTPATVFFSSFLSFFFQTFAQKPDTSSGSNHILHEAVRYLWPSAHS